VCVARFMLTGLIVLVPTFSQAQAPSRPTAPKLEPIAEVKLLMEGLAHPNFKALDRLLKESPADAEAWQFARGQSLLLAETANLLLLRPPKSAKAEAAWMARATEFRDAAVRLARTTSAQDAPKSQAALLSLATTCNRCHETFRVEMRVKPGEK